MAGYELRILGRPELRMGGTPLAVRSRKTWCLLAYLALEGRATREALASLLWASDRGLGNLRAELYRLDRSAPGLVTREDRALALAGVWVDALAFLQAAEAGGREEALALWRGPLLEGLERGLTPELEEWLAHQRGRLQDLHTRLLIERARAVEDPALAVPQLTRLLEQDPLNEEAVRALMRLHARSGAKVEALRVYRNFAEFLARELGLPPEPETRALARALREDPKPETEPRDRRFVGREAVLARMREAFADGRSILLSGEPGIGKTRLLAEFVARLGRRRLILRGRPGDRAVPYGSLARGLRELLAAGAEYPRWVMRELARVIPELGEPPSRGVRARFVSAVAEVLKPFPEEAWVLGVDDLQYLDSATAQLLVALAEELPDRPYLLAYRRDALPEPISEWVRDAVSAGRAEELVLEPLGDREAAELLGVELEEAAALNRYAGGNPFFLLQLARGASRDHPRSVIRNRLAGAGPLARRLAELAAVAGEAYRLELAIELLGTQPLEAAEASDALERLGLFRKGRVAHDLVAEAVLEGMDPEVRRYWHDRLARALRGRIPPAALAAHLLAAGKPGEAARCWFEAGLEAERAFAYREALELFDRALAHVPEEERERLEMESFVPRYRSHLALADWAGARALLDRAQAFARANGLSWLAGRAELGRADLDFRQGRFARALERADRLLARRGYLDREAEAHAHYLRAVALQALGRHRESRSACRRALAAGGRDWEMAAWVRNTQAIAEMHLGRQEEARRLNAEALARFREQENPVGEANALRVMAELESRRGRVQEADRLFEEALALARRTGHQIVLSFVLAAALRHHAALGRRDRVRELAREGTAIPGPYQELFARHR